MWFRPPSFSETSGKLDFPNLSPGQLACAGLAVDQGGPAEVPLGSHPDFCLPQRKKKGLLNGEPMGAWSSQILNLQP